MIKIIVVVCLLLIIYYFSRINNTERYQINRLDNIDNIDNIDNNIVLSNPFIWNQSTRFNRNSAPYLLLTPERFVLF
jgi:hypothetical protein